MYIFLLEQPVPLSHCSDEPLTTGTLPMNYSEVAPTSAAEFANSQAEPFSAAEHALEDPGRRRVTTRSHRPSSSFRGE